MSPIDRKIADVMNKHSLVLPAHPYISQRVRRALAEVYKFGFSRGKIERSRRQKEKK